MKKLTIASLSGFAASVAIAVPAFAVPVGSTIKLCPSSAGGACNSLSSDPSAIIANVLNFLFIIGAVAAILFLIWGGIKWITAGGDKTKVQAARETIIGAIIGLVIVFAAFFVVNFVLKILFGQDLNSGLVLPTLLK